MNKKIFGEKSIRYLLEKIIYGISSKQDKIKGTPGNILTFNERGDISELNRDIIKGEDGVSVVNITETTKSTESGGINIITVTLSNGKQSTFEIMNGLQGEKGKDAATNIADTSSNGLMSSSMVSKLNGIETGANKCEEISNTDVENIFNQVFK